MVRICIGFNAKWHGLLVQMRTDSVSPSLSARPGRAAASARSM